MKILKLHETLNNTGGIVSFQKDLEKFYSTSDNEYAHFRTGKVENHPLLSNGFIRLIDLAISYFIFPFILLKRKPDVIEINSGLDFKSFYRDRFYLKITRMIIPKAKIILLMHGWDEDFWDNMVENKPNSLRFFFDTADSVIVLADQFKNELINLGLNKHKLYVIRTGLDIKLFKSDTDQNFEQTRILFLARIEKGKGIFEFINAIPLLLKFNPDIIFDIAGSGSIFSEIQNHDVVTKHKDNIRFYGYINGEEKINLYKTSTIYVFPSYTEGCPVSILEAMAIGLPLIYTNVGALREILKDGVNGILVPIADSHSIVEAVKQLLSDPIRMKEMGRLNKQQAENDFPIEKIFNELEHIYLQ
ncbi:glycosyltransferase family 4 protein [Cecembia lonarensis]|uniref:Glycogen synthase n=1 Tax=Cecembia lonarensis (strain CCUG 58316 / KCTC 22772 / LW9) TaxID=1225176 RepID=K1LLQ7_CECL9|nr:glycosyltransferase family 4 protein [Cecembia lonarensis]EKB51328.1 Glycogen synthase [Cecembia lonarensis LW9]